jgi:hypothetical protein
MFSATLIVLVVLGQTPAPSSDAAALVEKLGAASFAEREATKSLESQGSKALPALRAALKSKDPEVRMRARALINKIEGNLLIQGSLVRLDFKDATLDEIFKSLSKQAGFEVGPGGMGARRMATGFLDRRVTLSESQPVSFWKAVDLLCAVGHLTPQYHAVSTPGLGAPQPGLVLSPAAEPFTQPGYNHGPFHFSLVSLSYQSFVTFNTPDRMRAANRLTPRANAGAPRQPGLRQPVEPLPAGAPGPAQAENAGNPPVRSAQCHVQLQIVPEPRMTFNPTGNIQVIEAVDELGQSLLPTRDNEQAAGPAGMNGFAMGATANLTARLHRPEAPGKLIKKLRGTVEVSVSATRPNPFVIPLEGAAGKTFQNDDRKVVVTSIDTDPMTQQQVIELAIDDMDQLFPAEPASAPAFGARNGMMGGRGFGRPPGVGAGPNWPIQVLTSKGQNAFTQTSIDRDSGRLTLRVPPIRQLGEITEIRISSIISATAKIPFEFHDLPMP